MSVTPNEWVWFIMGVSVVSLLMAWIFTREVLGADTGTAAMQAIALAIKQGAEAFMKRQYKTIYTFSVILAVLIFGFYYETKGSDLAIKMVVSFFAGAVCSGLAGLSGMFVSIRANLRAASAARTSLNRAMQLALRGGAVTGLSVVALSLLGVGIIFLAFGGMDDPTHVPYQIVGFGFGASFVALFAQLGGGIYTKAADVGADLVGKVEAGIPLFVGRGACGRAGALSGDVGIWSWGRGGGFSGTPGFSAFQNIQHFSINGAPANSFYQFAIYQPSVYPSGSPTFVANPLPMSGGTPP